MPVSLGAPVEAVPQCREGTTKAPGRRIVTQNVEWFKDAQCQIMDEKTSQDHKGVGDRAPGSGVPKYLSLNRETADFQSSSSGGRDSHGVHIIYQRQQEHLGTERA